MSRVIKFRVFDTESNRYIENDGNPNIFPFNGKIGMTCNGNGTGHIATSEWIQELYILEQFTGLYDKNGKEIYEGDIDKNNRVVIWSDRGTRFAFRDYSNAWTGKVARLHSIQNCEIIGNIHEGTKEK